MFFLFWIAVFVFLSNRNSDSGAAAKLVKKCHENLGDYCITSNVEPIRADVGLCVVIPCLFTTADGFTPEHMIWSKCDKSKTNCDESEWIFSSDTFRDIRTEFKGRVSLLEPDVNQRNCSIVIKDLSKSDSGFYQFRVNGQLNGKAERFSYNPKSQISVESLQQKPTVMVPPLTEGQQTTLTCSAPGLCSGSDISWTWRGAAEEDTSIPGNITAVLQGHTSTLTFNLTAKHHNSRVTCRLRLTGNQTTEQTVTLNVKYVKEVKVSGFNNVQEGKAVNLTCSVDSFPPSRISWTRLENNQTDLNNENKISEERERVHSLLISNVTAGDSGVYVCKVKYLNTMKTQQVNLKVINNPEKLCGSGNEVVPWILAGTSFAVNFVFITLMWHLWNKNQKLRSNREDRTYESLRKSKRSSEYDVIASQSR